MITISGKKSLPWIAQAVRRQIRKRNRVCKQFKETRDQQNRNKFVALRNSVKSSIKLSYETYLERLLVLIGENLVCDTKKLFIFRKSSKQDRLRAQQQSSQRLVTDAAEKADIHNLHFQSVFTTKEPLSLSRLCKMKLQDATDCVKITS